MTGLTSFKFDWTKWMKKCTAVCLLVTYSFRQAYNPVPQLPEILIYQWSLVLRIIFSSLNVQ